MQPESQTEIIQHLRFAAGHINTVSELVEAGKPSEEIRRQIGAIQTALDATMAKILFCQLEHSEKIILLDDSPEIRAAELIQLRSLYTLLLQHSATI